MPLQWLSRLMGVHLWTSLGRTRASAESQPASRVRQFLQAKKWYLPRGSAVQKDYTLGSSAQGVHGVGDSIQDRGSWMLHSWPKHEACTWDRPQRSQRSMRAGACAMACVHSLYSKSSAIVRYTSKPSKRCSQHAGCWCILWTLTC